MTTVVENADPSVADCTNAVALAITPTGLAETACACDALDPFDVTVSVADTAASTDAVVQIIGFNDSTTAAATATASIAQTTGAGLTTTAAESETVALSIDSAQSATADSSAAAAFTVDTPVSSTAAATDAITGSVTKGAAATDTAAATDAAVVVVTVNVTDTANSTATNSVVLDVGVTDTGGAADAASVTTAVSMEVSATAAATDALSTHLVATLALTSSAVARAVATIVDTTYPNFWMNTETEAGATWSNVPFNSYAMHEGQLYAAGPAGLYVFGVDKDAGSNITAEVVGDLTDFGDEHLKSYPSAYIGAASAGPLRLTLTTERASGSYDSIDKTTLGATNHRVILGRGLTGRYVRVALTNIDGKNFDGKTVDLAVTKLHRRV